MDMLNALTRAVDLAGGQSELARRLQAQGLQVKQQNIDYWIRFSKKAPGKFARGIETATDGQVTRYELRPDVFGDTPERVA